MDGLDKAHKPYTPMDTSCPQGTWVEEKRYNRGRPTEGSRRVLCGNWQEEEALEQDMLRREREAKERSAMVEGGNNNSTRRNLNDTASLDVIRDKGNGHYEGNFNSSPYLTVTAADADNRHLDTTHRTAFNANSSDVKQLRRPEMGVRSQQLLQQALADAAEEKAAHDSERAALRATTTTKREAGVGGAHGGLSELGDDRTTTVYKNTISNQAPACTTDKFMNTSANNNTVHELHQDYLEDEPITVYTGNPNSGKTMTVHGKTPVDPQAATRFGKHTNFTERKYDL